MKYLSTNAFIKQLDPQKKYCFILGAGCSASSDIPIAYKLALNWFKELHQSVKPSEILERAERAGIGNPQKYIAPDFSPDLKETLDDYNNICELRFGGSKVEENHYLCTLMENKLPFIGYFALANILTRTKSNIVITTNFDELVEKGIRDYTGKEPYTITHENMAKYAIEEVTGRPKILKIHRDITTEPFNRTHETETLQKPWEKPLEKILEDHIPIVIGYAGTDGSLTEYLKKANIPEIYWCHRFGSLPNLNATQIVCNSNSGNCVEIYEFDYVMCHVASILCRDSTFKAQIIGANANAGYYSYLPAAAMRAINKRHQDKILVRKYKNDYKAKSTPISYRALFIELAGDCIRGLSTDMSLRLFRRAFDYEMKRHNRYFGKAKYNIATTEMKMGRVEAAIKDYEELLSTEIEEPGSVYFKFLAKNNYVLALLRINQYEKAKNEALDYLKYRRCEPSVYDLLTCAYYLLGLYNLALETVEQGILCRCDEGLNCTIEEVLKVAIYEKRNNPMSMQGNNIILSFLNQEK